MIPCIEYTRASTNRQEYSVGDQDKQIRAWAKRNNYKIIKSYCDDGISGHYAAKRPGFLSMIEDITAERIDVKALLIWDSYRFARNMVEFLTYKQMIQQHGVSVIAISEPIVQDEDAQLYIDAINGASGELYLRKLSKDSKRGIRAKVVDRGEHLGFAPYGYRMDKNDGVLKIVEDEAQWVRYIFSEVENGTHYLQICHHLNDLGIRTRRGAEWSVYPLRYLLRNETYAGRVPATLDGDHGVYQGKHPAIIAPAQFDHVQKCMEERTARHKKYSHHTGKYVHWLSGLMRCPICGGSMSYCKGYGGRKPAYRCNNRWEGGVCSNGAVKVWIIEEAVYGELEKAAAGGLSLVKVEHVKPKTVVDIDGQLSRLQGQLTRAKRAYIEEIDTIEEYRENKTRIEDAIRKLEEKKTASSEPVGDPDGFKSGCLDALSFLRSDASMDEKSAVAHALIEKVEADSAKKEITVTFFG